MPRTATASPFLGAGGYFAALSGRAFSSRTKAFACWLKFTKAVMREFSLQSFADGRTDYFKNRVRRIG